jgi:diguanylate cyclase (GGDEF)-like protein/PAS domain S-box-containing protein
MKPDLLVSMDQPTLIALLNLIKEGIWDWNANTGFVYRSAGWYNMLEYDVHSLDNTVMTWENIIHPDDFNRVMEHFDKFITGQSDTYQIEYRCKKSDGDYLWIEDTATIVSKNDDGSVARVIGAHRDISSEKHIEEQNEIKERGLKKIIEQQTAELNQVNEALSEKISLIEKFAATDALTKISNRFGFETKLNNEISRVKRFNESLSLILFDLDNFKPVNDTFGHTRGDELLCCVGNLLKSHLRDIDLPVRWGGDEFMILLINTPLDHAKKLAEKIRVMIAEKAEMKELNVTASFGVAELAHDEGAKDFIIRAHQALYVSKHSGRNRVTCG